MAFIDEEQRVFRQIFEQGRRRLSRKPARQEAGIILDARAASGRRNHLQIEIGPLFEPLRFEQPPFADQLLQSHGQLQLDRLHCLFERRARSHIVRIGIDADIVERSDFLARQRIEFDNLLNLVAEKGNAPGRIFIVRGKQFQVIAAHAEIAAREGLVVAFVLQRNELADDLALVDSLALLQVEDHRRISLDRADAVKARDRGHDQHIIALKQRARRRMPHAVDGFVHRALFLDVRVRPGDIGLGLVVIVVGNEILDGIFGKETLELAIKLRGEDLIGSEHKRGPLYGLDHLGHGERLARTGHAQKNLIALGGFNPGDKFGNRRWLVARWLVFADDPELLAAIGFWWALRPVRNKGLTRFGLIKRRADC